MSNFSKEKYALALQEIRERLYSAGVLSEKDNIVFIESTALQIRKILELIAYLSVLVNVDKLSHKEKHDWHPGRIIDALKTKTTIFYPLPGKVIFAEGKDSGPVIVPLVSEYVLSLEEFLETYNQCGKILHAQHPLKDETDYASYFRSNSRVLDKVRALLRNHVIAIRHDSTKYTFLSVEFDFSNDEKSKPTYLREHKTKIFNEMELTSLFAELWKKH
ncbi:MAG: hypothetical protein WCT35_07365 [Sideroxydans sp.]|jgi:hypothetical protein